MSQVKIKMAFKDKSVDKARISRRFFAFRFHLETAFSRTVTPGKVDDIVPARAMPARR